MSPHLPGGSFSGGGHGELAAISFPRRGARGDARCRAGSREEELRKKSEEEDEGRVMVDGMIRFLGGVFFFFSLLSFAGGVSENEEKKKK